jgi:hypothetical protein
MTGQGRAKARKVSLILLDIEAEGLSAIRSGTDGRTDGRTERGRDGGTDGRTDKVTEAQAPVEPQWPVQLPATESIRLNITR